MVDPVQTPLTRHRARLKRQGLVRVEVRVAQQDAALIRLVASALADPAQQAETRFLLRRQLAPPPAVDLKALLASAPLAGIELKRRRDFGRTVDL